MNQRAELLLELLHNEHLYRMCIPFGALFDDAKVVAQKFLDQIEVMKQNAETQAQQAQQATQVPTE